MFAISMRNAPRIECYEEALRIYHQIKPVRGQSQDIRPVAERRAQHKRIVLNDDESISLRLYRTDCVTYHKPVKNENGEEVSRRVTIRTYDSQSTKEFMRCFMPTGMGVLMCNGRMFIGFVRAEPEHYKRGFFWIEPNGSSTAFESVNGRARWSTVEPLSKAAVVHDRKLIDREKSKAVREKIKPFLSWVKHVAALDNGDVTGLVGPHLSTRLTGVNAASMLLCEEVTLDDYPLMLSAFIKPVWAGPGQVKAYVYDNAKTEIIHSAYKAADAFIRVPCELGELPERSRW